MNASTLRAYGGHCLSPPGKSCADLVYTRTLFLYCPSSAFGEFLFDASPVSTEKLKCVDLLIILAEDNLYYQAAQA